MAASMNTARGPLLAALAALLLIGGGALWLSVRPGAAARGPLAGSGIGGPFALIDQDRRRVTDRDFSGKWRLIYFGYTFCPDVCPTDLARNAAALGALEKGDPDLAARVQPLFITVDPDRDTPQRLKAYVANFPPRLIGLTGPAPAVAAAERAFKVFAQKEPAQGGAAGYLMSHTDLTYLMDPNGAPVAFFTGGDTPQAVAAAIRRYAR